VNGLGLEILQVIEVVVGHGGLKHEG
jgi:hypothetical protein